VLLRELAFHHAATPPTCAVVQDVLRVHVPHYCHMFNTLMRGPRPWRFGHLYLPDGSRNLGRDDFALQPGSKAPLVRAPACSQSLRRRSGVRHKWSAKHSSVDSP
jgi:hypothetical protein